MCAVGVRISQEVGEGHGWEGVVISKGGVEEFHHCGCWWRGIWVSLFWSVDSTNRGGRVVVVRGRW